MENNYYQNQKHQEILLKEALKRYRNLTEEEKEKERNKNIYE